MRVCVVGAGVAGLVSAKVLTQDGFDVSVFEKDSTIGGVWSPSRAYPGLRTNNPRETYAFSDFSYPEASDEFPTAADVREYLESYVEHFGIQTRIRLSTEVVSISRRPPADGVDSHPGFRVTVRSANEAAEPETREFDYVVVCNGVFSRPHVPRVEGAERFDGLQLHSSEVVDPKVLEGKRVVVVGAGKSALDCATVAAREAASSTLVFRRPHWILPRYFFDRMRVDGVFFNRVSEMLLPAYHRATRLETVSRTVAAPFLWLWRKGMSRLIRGLSGMPPVMVPEIPVTSGAESIGIGEEFFDVLQRGSAEARRTDTVTFSGSETVQLDSGEQIEADLVVFATGWRQGVPFLEAGLRRQIEAEGRFQLFRYILPPRERRLGFVGYASSGNCVLTSEIAAHWLSQCFRGELTLPDAAAMEEEIARVREWTAKVFPKRSEGYFIGGYVSQYIDELMRDMGLRTRRTSSPFDEYLAPLWAERYRGLAEERRRITERPN